MTSSALRTWLEKLKSPHSTVRETSIRALELMGDTDALPALADVFATDPDPALRILAQKAGKQIYYGAIRRTLALPGASDEERQQAARILEQAQRNKQQNKRDR